jgi:adenylate cyclase
MAATQSSQAPADGLLSDKNLRTARLVSGMVLMVFVTMHLLNHAVLLVSVPAAEAVRPWFLLIWRNPLGTIILYGSVVVHLALVLLALYRRRSLVMPAREAIQVFFGLAIPLLLAEHVIGTRVFHALTGVEDDYRFVLQALWVDTPVVGFWQAVAIVVAWGHGCLGLFFWLRYRSWYPRAAPWLLVAAVLVPVLALLGFADGGRSVAEEGRVAQSVDAAVIDYGLRMKGMLLVAVRASFAGILVAVFVLRALRMRRERRNLIEIRYSDGHDVHVAKGHSVLEASRIGGIPHYAVCGGKGRCSTCRIKVSEGLDDLPAPEPVERATLARIGADPDVRLACQLRPTGNLSVTPLLVPDRRRALMLTSQPATPGREREIAILFCDIRHFTALADHRLPFDIVFLLNRYFAMVGKAVEQAGGRMDKFIGDGAMALFGVETTNVEACRQALVAAAAILDDLEKLNDELIREINAPLKVAIGIHAGPAIVGAMGYREVMNVTAIGDTVNVASRLELVAKELNAAVVVSEQAVRLAGVDLSMFEMREVDIRGRAQPLQIRVVPQGASIVIAGQSQLTSAA